jgi:hypothetical protein
MSAHWTAGFIGLPYEKGGQGPDAFNCWFFFAHVQLLQFRRTVPLVPQPDRLEEIVRTFRQHEADSGWRKVAEFDKTTGQVRPLLDRPRSGDGVLMAHLRYPSHIGTYVDDVANGSVLHSLAGQGSALPSMFHLKAAKWRITGFYRPVEEL